MGYLSCFVVVFCDFLTKPKRNSTDYDYSLFLEFRNFLKPKVFLEKSEKIQKIFSEKTFELFRKSSSI